ncbi:rasG protein [Capsaspora owczarzaki ATCC 30864]|uniref:RasG protein n=1 Tax=Capsaspora owczarzaki (strain ATCC 30864) TaxID=595528 RepID=A0A0D2WJX6_CAPO3|nr:rasG protein [Capsaspora owczarzaki ATCC 30864]KJE90450.1 rasG protein [Capsaspora owczarzaki ATCC 30864]|eukprot:XP_004364630.1 rasG protein [Capsaspora owczarzaki ATCC 30864]
MTDIKICVVGSGGVGKSCVTVRFLKQKFAEYYDPTIEESYRKPVTVDEKDYELEIVDTAGQDEFASFRDSSLDYGDGFLLVFGINSPSSFAELQELRKKILLMKEADSYPMVIVGNKKDLPPDQRTVSEAEVQAFCESINCPYYETSAKTGLNVEEVFFEVVRQIRKSKPELNKPGAAVAEKKEKKGGKCTIL